MTIFQDVGELKPLRTKFDLSYSNRYNCNMGEMIPSYIERVEAGDKVFIGQEVLCRLQALVSPVLDNLYISTEYFFVPFRLLYDKWEDFYTGYVQGSVPPEEFTDLQPEWSPETSQNNTLNNKKFSLWDYVGFPIDVDPVGCYPLDYPRSAYNLIYNEWYRDENLQDLVPLNNDKILYRSWRKDYFTSALPFRQKGVAPSIPISGTGSVVFDPTSKGYTYQSANLGTKVVFNNSTDGVFPSFGYDLDSSSPYPVQVLNSQNPGSHTFTNRLGIQFLPNSQVDLAAIIANGGSLNNQYIGVLGNSDTPSATIDSFSKWLSDTNSFNFENVGTFDASDMRDLFQLQKWMERNARAGTRYTEFLRAHFGVSPSDARLDRPEFLGSIKSSIIISEVLQTSASSDSSPQGNLAGKGLGVSKSFIDSYEVEEPGIIIGITTVYPRPSYQQGINRVWLRKSRFDQFYPEFVNLSEQGIYTAEIYASNSQESNLRIFAYTGIYDEMRVRHNQVCGDLRDTLDYWVMTRKFDTTPALNSEFITCKPSKNIFAVQDEPGIILHVYNDISAIRSLPFISEPGLLDHH